MKKITLLIATVFASFALMAQTVNFKVTVDMQPAIDDVAYGFKQASTTVVLAGNFNDWIQPGLEGTVYMTKGDSEMWTASVEIPATAEGTEVKFKIFILNDDKAPTWDFGDNVGGDRILMVYESDVSTKIKWGDPETVGLNFMEQLEVNVYPNPFNNSLTIENASAVKEIRISNILGQQVMHLSKLESKMVISTAHLQNGVYVVSIIDANNAITTKRIIKQ